MRYQGVRRTRRYSRRRVRIQLLRTRPRYHSVRIQSHLAKCERCVTAQCRPCTNANRGLTIVCLTNTKPPLSGPMGSRNKSLIFLWRLEYGASENCEFSHVDCCCVERAVLGLCAG